MTAYELDLMETVLPCCVYHSSHEAVIVHAQNKTRSPRGFTRRGTASGDNFVNHVNRCCATDVSFAEAITADWVFFFILLSVPDGFLKLHNTRFKYQIDLDVDLFVFQKHFSLKNLFFFHPKEKLNQLLQKSRSL